MAEIEQTLIADIVGRLPQLIPWNREDLQGQQISLLIVCAGFEERAVAIVDEVANTKLKHLLIVEYPTNTEDNASAIARLESIPSATRSRVKYDRSTFLSEICRKIEAHTGQGEEVLIDVSAMASYVTSRVLKALWDKSAAANTRLFYAEAREYHPTKADWMEFFSRVTDPEDNLSIAESYEATYFQSRGVEETYECDAFPGRNEGPLATELIAIPSFSLQRVKSMTTFAEARYNVTQRSVHWFLGSPPDKVKNGWRFDAIARLYNVRSGGVSVDTRDYRDVVRKLDEAWGEALRNERHLVIAGMGSKMQNIGVFLFLSMHPECGLLHCEPKEFIAGRYTDGVGPKWCLNIGRVGEIKDLLLSRGRLSFRW